MVESFSEKYLDKDFLAELVVFLKEKPSKEEIAKKKVLLCKKHGLKKIPTDIEIFLNLEESEELRKVLQTKPIRTSSGVAPVALMTRPHKCPRGKCVYCPGGEDSFFGDVPQSYTGNEPATMRGIRNNYDAYLQVFNRLEQYIAIGQSPEKVELIIMGGTFISLSKEYQDEFVKDAFNAMNDFSDLFYKEKELDVLGFKKFFELPGSIRDEKRGDRIRARILEKKILNKDSLKEAHKKNESSIIRCVGLTIETKPDQGFKEQGLRMLELGCTRVELGVQTLRDDVLKKIRRGHSLDDTKKSIQELRDMGFKLNFHMMPGLPGVTLSEEKKVFKELFSDENFKPDMLKIYPLMVMPGTELFEEYKKGTYQPLTTSEAVKLLAEVIPDFPEYCRVMRVQRDIPPKYAVAGVDRSNLRQMVDDEIMKQKKFPEEIRAREIKGEKIKEPVSLNVKEYDASNGKEFFISFTDANNKLLGFVRMRFPSTSLRKEITTSSALIRELHVYGFASSLQRQESNTQHKGLGKKLMKEAERIAKQNGKEKIVVISGIGVREYYNKLGYYLEGPYMVKNL